VAQNVKSVCVRFYLDKALHRKAYEYLNNQSKSQAIITAIVDYFDNQERENRLVEKITDRLSGFAPAVSTPIASEVQKTDEILSAEIDYDFLGS
jgi:hypothetical protein